MLGTLRKFFSSPSPGYSAAGIFGEGAPDSPEIPTWNNKPVGVFGYPGNVIVSAPPEKLLQGEQDNVDRLDQALGMSDANFKLLMYPVLLRFASWVHLLPASQNHHHCDQGGMLKHGLEVAFFATRKVQASVIDAMRLEPKKRAQLAPRYAVAGALVGLLHDLGKVLVDMSAVDEDLGTREWDCSAMSLYDWLVENKIAHYKVAWQKGDRHGKHERFAALVAREIIGPTTLRWLVDEGGKVVAMCMWELLTGIKGNIVNPLSAILIQADSMSVEVSQAKMSREAYSGANGRPKNVAVRLLNAIEQLANEQSRSINLPGQFIFVGEDGVFGKFPELLLAAATVARQGATDKDGGIPIEPLDLAHVLMDAAFITRHTSSNMSTSIVWDICINVGGGNTFSMQAVRFDRPEHVFGGIKVPPPIEIRTGSQVVNVAPHVAESIGQKAPGRETPAPATDPSPGVNSGIASTAVLADTTTSTAQDSGSPVIENRRESDTVNKKSWNQDSRERITIIASKEEVESWIKEKQSSGIILESLARCAREGNSVKWGRDIDVENDRVVALFPDAFIAMAIGIEPKGILDLLKAERLIEQDTASPDRMTVTAVIGNKSRNGIRFTAVASQALMFLSPPTPLIVVEPPSAITPPRASESAYTDDATTHPPAQVVTDRGKLFADKDRAFLRVVGYAYLDHRFPKIERRFSELSSSALKDALGRFRKEYLSDTAEDVWWKTLQSDPYPLVELSGSGTSNKVQFNTEFSPELIEIPSGFYTRFPTLKSFPV